MSEKSNKVTEPQAPEETVIQVKTLKKINLRYIRDYNDAEEPKPIMWIYPTNGLSTMSQRIQYPKNTVLSVLLPVVIADGGMRYRQLKNKMFVRNPRNPKQYIWMDMFVRNDEIKRVSLSENGELLEDGQE